MAANFTIYDILTPEQVTEACAMYKQGRDGFAQAVCDKFIQPRIEEINQRLGQENDPKFLAYAVEYVMARTAP